MNNIQSIKNNYKEVLLKLNKSEIEALYKNVNKKAVDSLGTVKNNFSYNPDEINRANDELKELDKILVNRFPNIAGLGIATRLDLLIEKYSELTDEAQALICYIQFKDFFNLINALELKINYLRMVLNKFYFRYSFRVWNLERLLINELKVPDEMVLNDLEPYIYYDNSFFDKGLEKDFNFFIEEIVKNIESDIAEMDKYIKSEFDLSSYSNEDVIKTIEGLIELQKLAKESIKSYEDIRENPFKRAIEIEAEVKTDILNNLSVGSENKYSIDEEKELILSKAPTYNFETFELIVPAMD